MSELKVASCFEFEKVLSGKSNKLFYSKLEVDKVISDSEESHKKEVEQLLMAIMELKADYKEACDRLQTANLIKDEKLAEARHEKYKRCLAMARWCDDKIDAIENGYIISCISTQNGVMMTCPLECNPKFSFYSRWHKRWLELAEKFKEVK